jgi:hypothetical protein
VWLSDEYRHDDDDGFDRGAQPTSARDAVIRRPFEPSLAHRGPFAAAARHVTDGRVPFARVQDSLAPRDFTGPRRPGRPIGI